MKVKKVIARDYNFSDATLKQKADIIALCVLRDIILFATRGITNTVVLAFKAMVEAFDNIPTDDELQGDASIATENKEKSGELLKSIIRTIRTMAENKWGTMSSHYKAFNFDGIDTLSDDQLHRMAKRVVRVATKQLSDLASEGLTIDIINDLKSADTKFDDDIDVHAEAVRQREIVKIERIEKGNEVYKEMSKLCNTGKDLFASTNEAKYNDYIIYDTPTGNAPEDATQTGSIHGNITDGETEEALTNVLITLEKVVEPIESDEDGDYENVEVPVSCKKLTAELYGYEKYEGSITILPGQDTTFDFMMTPMENPPLPADE